MAVRQIVNPMRHLDVFNPTQFGDRRVDIIGAGATGSKIAMELAKLGIRNIHVWDFDVVESHNIANQLFGNGDIGKLKVDALKERILADTGIEISTHPVKVTVEDDGGDVEVEHPDEVCGDVIYLLVDSMSVREEIFNELENNMTTELLVETRMGPDNGRVYAFNPNVPSHVENWRKTLYSDEQASTSACGAATSVGPTASLVSSYAVWKLIRWFELGGESESASKMINEMLFDVRNGNNLKASWAS